MDAQLDRLRDDTIAQIITVEGGYSNNPADSGGATRYGVTERVARRHGYTGPMSALPRATAEAILRAEFWDALRLSEIGRLSVSIAAELADSAVNLGPGTAAIWLQRALNVFNLRGKLYPDLKVDGAIGPVTIAALAAYLRARQMDGETVMLRTLNALQAAKYVDLAEKREKDEAHVFGWILNRVQI